jgi:lipopolysaccharide export system permease protein
MRLPLPKRVDRYIARHVLLATLGVWAVLLGFDIIVSLSDELGDVGKGSYTLSHAVMFQLFTIPRRLYQEFPYVAVIGSLLGLGGLAARSELTAIRAAGVSKLRIGLAALLPLACITVLMLVNIETVGPAGEQRAQMLANAKSGQLIMARYSGLWAREGQLFLNARAGGPRQEGEEAWIELQDVRLYQFDGDGRLRSLAVATTAEHRGGKWMLRGVERAHFLPRSVHVEKVASERWDTTLDEQSLVATLAKPRYLSLSELRANIAYLERNQLDASQFISTYWGRWFYPVTVIVLVLATLPFAFSSLRSGGFGKRLFIGILIGLGYILAETLLVRLADVYRFDVRLAYALPPVILTGIVWGWIGRRL